MIQSSQVQYPEIENVPRDFPFWPEAAETAADPGPLEELEESEPFCWLSFEDEELEEAEEELPDAVAPIPIHWSLYTA